MALSEECTVLYMCSTPYAPSREHGVHPLDPALGIGWPADIRPALSAKDAAAPTLAEAQQSGLLPQTLTASPTPPAWSAATSSGLADPCRLSSRPRIY